jgi:ABC-type microcin C transport system permease subunit YejB
VNFIKKNKHILLIILFCFVTSFLLILINSKSSPLYPFNDWVDANAFFTMGKGLFNGKILYQDLFEQKGPLLYLIYGFGYLFSNTTFLGIFLIEVIFFTFFSILLL